MFTDYLTKWTEAYAIPDGTAETVAKVLLTEIIPRHGAPKVLLSDQGTNFMSDLIKEVARQFRVKKINTSPYHPQTNGLTERFNKTLCQMLSFFVNDTQTDWDEHLSVVLYAYRTSVNESIKQTPFKTLYGREARLPSDLDQTTSLQVEKFKEVWKKAKFNFDKAAAKYSKYYNEKSSEQKYKKGDLVRLNAPYTDVGLKTKLRKDIWQGPYKIVQVLQSRKNVILDINGKNKTIHMNRIKPAEKIRQLQSTTPKGNNSGQTTGAKNNKDETVRSTRYNLRSKV
jgi:hypothetical protein